MASVDDRLRRLRDRIGPSTPEMTPEARLSLGVLLKAQDAYRRELDGLEPDPGNGLTPEEEAFDRDEARAREWVAYLEGELSRAPPGNPMHEAISDALAAAKAAPEDPQRGAP